MELVILVGHYAERFTLDLVSFRRHELLGLRDLLLAAVIVVLFWLSRGIQKVDYGLVSMW